MVVLRHRKSRLNNMKSRMTSRNVRRVSNERLCPKCLVSCVVLKIDADTARLRCPSCGDVIKFTDAIIPGYTPGYTKTKEMKIGPITIRDRSEPEKKKEEPDQPDPKALEELQKTLDTIRNAVSENKIVRFSYTGRDGKQSDRSVEVYKISRDGSGCPVIYAYCLEAEGIRLFKLKNVASIQMLDMTYTNRWPIEDELEPKK